MSVHLAQAYETLSARIDHSEPPSEWYEISKDRVNAFADITLDHQWIHVDEERSRNGPFGKTIAHGHLTLSIMGQLPSPQPRERLRLEGHRLTINYGFDRVRFPAPVPVGSRIRMQSTLRRVEVKGGMIELMNEIVVEVEGQDKPCCVAENLTRLVIQ